MNENKKKKIASGNAEKSMKFGQEIKIFLFFL
jgi:hypothetical protein